MQRKRGRLPRKVEEYDVRVPEALVDRVAAKDGTTNVIHHQDQPFTHHENQVGYVYSNQKSESGITSKKNRYKIEERICEINHPVSFVPILDYSGIFSHATNKIYDRRDQRAGYKRDYHGKLIPGTQNSDLRAQALSNLQSDPSLAYIFNLKNLGGVIPKLTSDGDGNNPSGPWCVPTPTWSLIHRHDFFHHNFYELDTIVDSAIADSIRDRGGANCNVGTLTNGLISNSSSTSTPQYMRRLKEGAFPVTSLCTCMASTSVTTTGVRVEYVAVGDTAGYVTIYAVVPSIRAINRLETSASQRESVHDMELLLQREERRKRGVKKIGVARDGFGGAVVTRSFDPKATLTSQSVNAIESISFTSTGKIVITGTKHEIEAIDCITGTIIWSIPTSNIPTSSFTSIKTEYLLKSNLVINDMDRGPPIRLDSHPFSDYGGVLASFTFSNEKRKKLISLSNNTTTESSIDTENAIKLGASPCLMINWADKSSISSADNFIVHQSNIDVRYVNIIPSERYQSSATVDINENNDLIIGSRSSAMWDRSHPHRIIATFVIYNSYEDGKVSADGYHDLRNELVLLDSRTQRTIYKAQLPARSVGVKYRQHDAINQSEHGIYTIVAPCTKGGGIWLFLTDGLQVLAIYGEGISLHGHSLSWQQCFFIRWGNKISLSDKNQQDIRKPISRERRRGRVVEREDELFHRMEHHDSCRQSKAINCNESFKNLFIVGIPCAYKEPMELNNTIHVWDLSALEIMGGQKRPSFTLKVPGQNSSILSLLFFNDAIGGENGKFVVISGSGEFHQLVPTVVSDWAGVMYPPGYILIDENIAFLEDEDALDVILDDKHQSSKRDFERSVAKKTLTRSLGVDERFEADLQKALLLSVLEQTKAVSDSDNIVDIIGADSSTDIKSDLHSKELNILPCRPEPYLQEKMSLIPEQIEPSSPQSKQKGLSDSTSFIDLFPTDFHIDTTDGNKRSRSLRSLEDTAEVDAGAPSTGNVVHSRSTKKARIEAAMKESVDSCLRKSLIDRELYADGSGSSIFSWYSTPSINGALCLACMGRMTRHICGKRLIPVDFDAIKREQKEKEHRERLEKKKLQVLKRKDKGLKKDQQQRPVSEHLLAPDVSNKNIVDPDLTISKGEVSSEIIECQSSDGFKTLLKFPVAEKTDDRPLSPLEAIGAREQDKALEQYQELVLNEKMQVKVEQSINKNSLDDEIMTSVATNNEVATDECVQSKTCGLETLLHISASRMLDQSCHLQNVIEIDERKNAKRDQMISQIGMACNQVDRKRVTSEPGITINGTNKTTRFSDAVSSDEPIESERTLKSDRDRIPALRLPNDYRILSQDAKAIEPTFSDQIVPSEFSRVSGIRKEGQYLGVFEYEEQKDPEIMIGGAEFCDPTVPQQLDGTPNTILHKLPDSNSN